jgi:hypothetical protein
MHCDSVLELPIRSIYSSNTQIGDQLKILTPEEMQAHWDKQRQPDRVVEVSRAVGQGVEKAP